MTRVRRSIQLREVIGSGECAVLGWVHRGRHFASSWDQDRYFDFEELALQAELLLDHPKTPRGEGWSRVTPNGVCVRALGSPSAGETLPRSSGPPAHEAERGSA